MEDRRCKALTPRVCGLALRHLVPPVTIAAIARTSVARLIGLVLALTTASALAGQLDVAPTKIHLSADGRPKMIHLINRDAASIRLRIEAVRWAPAGRLGLRPKAGELSIMPSSLDLPAGSKQTIRIAVGEPMEGGIERAYRLLINEMPPILASGGPNLAVRLNMPLFVTPVGAGADPVWSLRRSAAGEPQLVLENQGDAHLFIHRLELRAAGRGKPLYRSNDPIYVLARAAHRWPIGFVNRFLPGNLELHVASHLGFEQLPILEAPSDPALNRRIP